MTAQRLLRHLLSKHSLRRLQRLDRARQGHPVAAHAIKVSDVAMAGETTPVTVAARTQVRVGTAMTVVAIVTIAIEAPVVKVASEVKAEPDLKVAVTVVATEAALASVRHAVAIVMDHAVKAGRTRVVVTSKVPTAAPIRVLGRIRLRAQTRAAVSTAAAVVSKVPVPIRVAASIKAPGVISLRARINRPVLSRAKARFETTLVTAQLREPPDRTPMEMVRAAIGRTVATASAVADGDVAAADAVVAAEAKAAIAKVARRAVPWALARKAAVGQRTRSLPKPLQCRRLTVVTITTTVARAKARTNSRVLRRSIARRATSRSRRVSRNSHVNRSRLMNRNRCVRPSRLASRSRSIGHLSLNTGLRSRNIERLSLSSGSRRLHRST